MYRSQYTFAVELKPLDSLILSVHVSLTWILFKNSTKIFHILSLSREVSPILMEPHRPESWSSEAQHVTYESVARKPPEIILMALYRKRQASKTLGFILEP